jgi:hypothetical protein
MYALQFKFDSRKYMAVCDGMQYVSDKPTLFRTKKEAIAAKSAWGFRGCWNLIKTK